MRRNGDSFCLSREMGKIFLQMHDVYLERGMGMGEEIGVTGKDGVTLDKMIFNNEFDSKRMGNRKEAVV